MSGVDQRPREEERMRLRIAVLDAYLRAAKRREEVMDVISDAPDREEARQLVGRLLGVTEVGAESASAKNAVASRRRCMVTRSRGPCA